MREIPHYHRHLFSLLADSVGRLIDQVVGHDLEPYVFSYLDHIILVTPSFEEHNRHLGLVLERYRRRV